MKSDGENSLVDHKHFRYDQSLRGSFTKDASSNASESNDMSDINLRVNRHHGRRHSNKGASAQK